MAVKSRLKTVKFKLCTNSKIIMNKIQVPFIISGALIGIGIFVLFYGSQLIISGITIEEGNVDMGEPFEVFSELDSAKSKTGVFVVQKLIPSESSITATVFDPSGNSITTKSFEEDSFEDSFEITSTGEYMLFIEKQTPDKIQVVGGIGNQPTGVVPYVAMGGFIIIVIGLIGLVLTGIRLAMNKRMGKVS